MGRLWFVVCVALICLLLPCSEIFAKSLASEGDAPVADRTGARADGVTRQVRLVHLRQAMEAQAFVSEVSSLAALIQLDAEFQDLALEGDMLPSDWRLLIHLALRQWQFDLVETYRRRSETAARLLAGSSLPSNVEGTPTARRPFWELDADSPALLRSDLRVSSGRILLVAFHPLCHVCQRLIADIEADAVMRPFSRQCVRWIGLVEGNFNLEVYRAWTSRHPDQRLVFLKDWSLIGYRPVVETPTFLLMQDGQVLDTLVGYPKGTGMEAVESFLTAHAMNVELGC